MKKLLLVLVFLVSAGSLFAADLKVTGNANVRGTTLDNMALTEKDQVNYSYFDYDLNLNLALIANEKATVFAKLTYDKNVGTNGVVKYSAEDSTLAVERAYLNYKFHPAFQVKTGLMSGGQWGYAFGNSEINVMRVQAIGALSKDAIFIYTYEKKDDQGQANSALKNSEKDDTTVNYLAGIFNLGPVKVQPLFVYGTKGINNNGDFFKQKAIDGLDETIEKSNGAIQNRDDAASYLTSGMITTEADFIAHNIGDNKAYTLTTTAFDLAIGGDFGMFGFESEFVYKKVDAKDFVKDWADSAEDKGIYDGATMGYYVNLFANIKPAKVGFVYAYGSADEKKGKYNWGDDFDVFTVMDDYINNNPDEFNIAGGLSGYTVYKLYGSATFDKITVDAAVGYGVDNANWKEEGDAYKVESSFMEYDLGVAYAIDENTTYSIAGGLAQTKTNDADTDKEISADAWRIYHKMAIKF